MLELIAGLMPEVQPPESGSYKETLAAYLTACGVAVAAVGFTVQRAWIRLPPPSLQGWKTVGHYLEFLGLAVAVGGAIAGLGWPFALSTILLSILGLLTLYGADRVILTYRAYRTKKHSRALHDQTVHDVKKNITKPDFSATVLYITSLVVLGTAAVVFAILWYFRLVPLEPDWGDWATWVGSVGTMAGFAIAILTLRHNADLRRQGEEEDRLAQARRVGITSTMSVEPAPAPWKAHKDAWKGGRGHPDMPSIDEQAHLDAYTGPWVGKVIYTAQNGTPYPLFSPVVTVDTSKVCNNTSSEAETRPAPKVIPLPALIPGSTTSGTFSLELSVHPGEDMVPDLVEMAFTDVWKERWLTTSKGCEKIIPPTKGADDFAVAKAV